MVEGDFGTAASGDGVPPAGAPDGMTRAERRKAQKGRRRKR